MTPVVVHKEPSDPNLNQQLVQSDAEALSELDEAPVVDPDIPDRAKIDLDKPDVPAEGTPAPPEAAIEPEPPKEDQDLDEALEAIQPKRNAHPGTLKGYDALKKVAKEERAKFKTADTARKELEAKYASLESEYKGKIITPEIEAELKDLREERRAFHIENDLDFQAKYSNKLQEIDSRAITILKTCGMSDAWVKFVTDNGGVIAMYNSSRLMPAGTGHEGSTYQQFIEEVLMPKLPPIQKTRLEQAIGSGMDLREEMQREIEHAKTHGSELQQKKQKEIEDQFNQSVDETRKSLGSNAVKMEYPAQASKEEKARVDKHNARVEKAEKMVQAFIQDGRNPKKVAEALVKAGHSQILMDELQDKGEEVESWKKRAEEAEDKLKKIKDSGSTGRQSSAPPPNSQPAKPKIISDQEALAQWK